MSGPSWLINMLGNDDLISNLGLETIDDFTKSFLTKLLQKCWESNTCFKEVEELSIEKVHQGVLSCVFRVHAKYAFDFRGSDRIVGHSIPNQWIVKLPRKDLDLDWMFRSERIFYEVFAPELMRGDLVFTVPRMLFASDKCIILEGIEDVTCYSLMSGTPLGKIDFAISALASLHAKSFKSAFFESRTELLNGSPGMGHRLHPLQKEYLFTCQWRDAVGATQLQDPSTKDFINDLCEAMETRRLRDVHEMVHKDRYACVHGDYHIANFLFPDDKSKKPTLVDWATFGFGNPMTDLAFFLVLNDTVAGDVEKWLFRYYQKLTEYNPDFRLSFSFQNVFDNFRLSLLYQWIILVTYNSMNVRLAAEQENPRLLLQHFENINRRAIIVMHGVKKFEPILERIPTVTEHERAEAKIYSLKSHLSI